MNHPSVFGKSLHRVVERESHRAVARVRTGQGSSAGSSSARGIGVGLPHGYSPDVAKSRLWQLCEIGHRTWCELCVVRPWPQGQDGTTATRTSWTGQESQLQPSWMWPREPWLHGVSLQLRVPGDGVAKGTARLEGCRRNWSREAWIRRSWKDRGGSWSRPRRRRPDLEESSLVDEKRPGWRLPV